MDRILICQPVGGINDMLCQIGLCIQYSQLYNRKLIIDTRISDLHDHLTHYFTTNELGKDIQLELSDEQITKFYKDPLFPKNFYLRYGDNLEPNPISFDKDYEGKFLIHRYWGGGTMSIEALKHLKLVDPLSKKIKDKKKTLGTYHAILIRNTDYTTNYIDALVEIKEMQLSVPLFVFTDSVTVQNYAKSLKFNRLILNENLYKRVKDKNIPIMHYSRLDPLIHPFEINDTVLTDLFLSSLAEHIYPTYIEAFKGEKFTQPMQSGFVRLALMLNNNKELLNSILGG